MQKPRVANKSDIPSIAQLLSVAWRECGAESEMHIGDLYWSLFNCQKSFENRQPLIWQSADEEILAFSMLSPNHWLDLVLRPGKDPLAFLPAIVSNAERSVSSTGKTRIRIGRRVDDHRIASWLESAGYRRMTFGYPTLEHSLERIPASEAPKGFALKSVTHSPTSLAARTKAWNAAFPDDARDIGDIESLMCAPGYRADLDFVCETQSEVGAFCTVWYDERTKSGLFEPVGTAANFQRQGLATAVVLKALARLKEFGAETAYVRVHSENEPAAAFYRAVGFRRASTAFGFERFLD